ncbi:MAG: hypothetical protein WCE68_13040 [Anaerolineales bacterium]
MFRHPQNPAPNAGPLGPGQLQALNQANQLVANGQPALAAPIFASLASAMEKENHPRRAANLHAQAAHAYADSRQEQPALAQARTALNLFIQYQMNQRTPMFYGNITRKLTNHGLAGAAQALAQEYGGRVGAIPAAAPAPKHHGALPTNCPKCGAPLHSNEATWIDDITVECAYCGVSIRAE